MGTNNCSMGKKEKHTNSAYKTFPECTDCNRARGLEGYYDNKDKISNQKKYILKRIEKKLVQKKIKRCIHLEI